MVSLDYLAYNVRVILEVDNLHIYNFLTLVEFNMLFLFCKGISKEKLTKTIIKYSLLLFNIIFIITTAVYIYRSQFFDTYNSVATAVGSILIAIVLFLFFREMLLSNKVLNFKKELPFWITLGLLVYYLGSTPVTSLMNFLKEKSIITVQDFNVIQLYLLAFMHACFIFGILWSYKRVK
jgi:hypothetical protein